jgi:hypothetical protein
MRRAQRPSDPTGPSETSRGRRTTAPATRRVRTKLDDGHEPVDDRTMAGTRQGAAPGIAAEVGETELVDWRQMLPSRMHRDDVIDRDGTARARRRLPVNRLSAELAAVVGSPVAPASAGRHASSKHGHEPAEIYEKRGRSSRSHRSPNAPGDAGELLGRDFWPDVVRVGRALKNGSCLS